MINVMDMVAELVAFAEAHESPYAYRYQYPSEFATHELLRGTEDAESLHYENQGPAALKLPTSPRLPLLST